MLETLVTFATVMLALSVASERLVELFKGFSEDLTGKKLDAAIERKRQLKVHWLSLLTSAAVVFLLQDYIKSSLDLPTMGAWEFIAFTILASGGSSTWNSIVSYLLSLKNIKQQTVNEEQKTGNADLAKGLPTSMPTL